MKRIWEIVEQGWYLGFTAFGGPPVHFKIVRMRQFPMRCWKHHSPGGSRGCDKLLILFDGSSMINMLTNWDGSMSRWLVDILILEPERKY
jgi:hypothetical protein